MLRSDEIKRVAVVGAGTMGSAIAQHFVMKGLKVKLVDLSEKGLERGRDLIEESLQEAVDRRVIREEQREQMMSSLQTSVELESLFDCQLVVEAVFEDFDVKKNLFENLETYVPQECILASNTSSYSVTDLAQSLKHPERFLGVHYFYHAAKNKLVEIIPGANTDRKLALMVKDFYSFYDKLPILVQDAAGFAVNRFFVPWLNESVRLYEEGKASPSVIDEIACEVFQIGMGPFALMNATGVPIAYHAAEGLAEKFGSFYKASNCLKSQVEKGQPWDLRVPCLAGKEGRSQEDRDEVKKRLLGAALGIAAQMVSEGVTSATDADLGARIGLRWTAGPFEMIHKLGRDKAAHLIGSFFSQWDMVLPPVLESEIKLNWVNSYTKGDLGVLEFNRPDSMNALNESVMRELSQKFDHLENQEGVRKIILTGVGKAFVAGADIKFFVDHIDQGDLKGIYDFTRFGQEVLNKISNSKKTTVAYVDGLTLGGGLELALACHYRVGTERTVMAFPETGIGIYPGLGGTQRTPRRIGKGLAKFLIATGKMIKGREAQEYGLIDVMIDRVSDVTSLGSLNLVEAKPASNLLEEAFKSFDGLVSENLFSQEVFTPYEKILRSKAPLALKKAMEFVDAGEKMGLEEAVKLELSDLDWIFSTQDARAGLVSVLNRQRPIYTGK